MATPISPRDLSILLACGASLPFAAFFAALPLKGGKRILNIVSFIIGLAVISIVAIEMYRYR